MLCGKNYRGGWNPPSFISEEEYNAVKNNRDDYPDYYVGYVGFHASFASKYFAGYGRNRKYKREVSNESYINTMKQVPYIKDVIFINDDYVNNEYSDIKNAVIYCDPPYAKTTGYKTKQFDYDKFWDWCRKVSQNNFVFISSYDAPDDFVSIWSREVVIGFDCNRKGKEKQVRVENLFVYKDYILKYNLSEINL